MQETNLDKFEVERSSNGRDYNRIGSLKAGANSYEFSDVRRFLGSNYYRLKIVNRDGEFEFSPVRESRSVGGFQVTLYPNPLEDLLQITIKSDKKTSAKTQVVSFDGQIILTNELITNEGITVMKVNVSGLKRGIYFLKTKNGEGLEINLKFEKM